MSRSAFFWGQLSGLHFIAAVIGAAATPCATRCPTLSSRWRICVAEELIPKQNSAGDHPISYDWRYAGFCAMMFGCRLS